MIDDLKTIEKSKRVQWDQQAGYRELFRHSQIWERQAAIACRGSPVCFIPIHSIPAGAHKRTKNLITAVVLVILGPAVWVGVLGHATPAFPYAHPALFSMTVAFAGIWVFSVTDHSQKAREEARTFTAQYIRSQIGRGAAGAASH